MNKEIQFLMYSTPQGDVNVEAVVRDETLWLTQKAMAQLFGVQVPAISKHLKNIYAEGELLESTTISKMETVVQRGFRGGVEVKNPLRFGVSERGVRCRSIEDIN